MGRNNHISYFVISAHITLSIRIRHDSFYWYRRTYVCTYTMVDTVQVAAGAIAIMIPVPFVAAKKLAIELDAVL